MGELIWGLVMFVMVISLSLTIWAVIDLIQRPQEQFPRYTKAGKSDKTSWIIVLVVAWFLGLGGIMAIVYLIVVRKKMGPVVHDTSRSPADAAPPGVPQT